MPRRPDRQHPLELVRKTPGSAILAAAAICDGHGIFLPEAFTTDERMTGALSGQPEVLVIYFVADLVRELYVGHAMKLRGAGEKQIAGEFKLWGPRQALFMAALSRFSPQAVGRKFERIIQADRRSNSGFGEPLRGLECFCAAVGR